jgi:hypothetical protein
MFVAKFAMTEMLELFEMGKMIKERGLLGIVRTG